jgi:hypothetical protein
MFIFLPTTLLEDTGTRQVSARHHIQPPARRGWTMRNIFCIAEQSKTCAGIFECQDTRA